MANAAVERSPGRGRYDRSLSAKQRAARQRERLVRAATDVLDSHGTTAVTVSRVIDRAKMGRNTFYAHFDNVEDLLGEVREQGLDRLVGVVERGLVTARTPLERLRILTTTWLGAVSDHPRLAAAVLSHTVGTDPTHLGGRATERVFDLLCDVLYDAYDDGAVAHPPDEVRAWVLAAGIVATSIRCLDSEMPDASSIADVVVDLTLRAFR